jgi:hypothetical protein
MEDILMFIKFTKEKYAEKLLNGQMYFNLPTYYNFSENEEIGDPNEGAKWIDNSKIKNIRVEYPDNRIFEFNPSPNADFKLTQFDSYFLSFSLYTVYRSAFNNSHGTFKIDAKMSNSKYDTALVIENPIEFLKVVTEKLKQQKIEYEMKSVTYKDFNTGKLDLTPFDKKEEHIHQNEFRIIIKNLNNSARTINIGPIKEFCKLVPSQAIIESFLKANRNN